MLPLINQPYYKKIFNLNEDDYPVAKWINNNGFYIASHQGLSETEREYIVEMFDSYFYKRAIQREKACLVVMSKRSGRAASLVVDQLPLAGFDEYVFVEASGDKAAAEPFRKNGF